MSPRNRSIDAFRGLSIVLMVFFTVILKLSSELPDAIKHNSRSSLHFGDFVLPMFLFASGLSIAYFLESRKIMDAGGAGGKDREGSRRTVGERFLRLALVGVLLSPWSTRGFLEMDEVMLSALLFLGCVFLSRLDWKMILALILIINSSYLVLIDRDWTGVFYDYYLGGYPAALYYFPVMLTGLLVGRNILSRGEGEVLSRENGTIVLLVGIMFTLSWSFTSIEKLKATPSFMMLAILLCFLIFTCIDRLVRSLGVPEELEYLGRKPFRYWIMMYVLFIIPLKEWAGYTGTRLPLDLSWETAVIGSFALLVGLWMVSKLIDAVGERM